MNTRLHSRKPTRLERFEAWTTYSWLGRRLVDLTILAVAAGVVIGCATLIDWISK